MMRVLLIMPVNCDVIHSESLPLGIMSIATYLKNSGIETQICDLSIKRQSLKKILDSFRPDIVGLSVTSIKAVDGALEVSRKIRRRNIPIVWGGPFCDGTITRHIFDTGLVDIVSFREGEETWLDLIKTIEKGGSLSEVNGIAFLQDDKITITKERPFMDPQKLPRISFDDVDVPLYFQHLYGCKKLLYLYWSKGCPGQCTFCYNHTSHKHLRRKRPLSVFFDEVNELITKYDMDGFYMADELAFASDSEVYEFCDHLDSLNLAVKFGFQTRIGTLSKDAIMRAYKSGCRWIDFGVESGNKDILKKFRKNIPYDKIEETFDACNDAQIISIANFIIGFPDETREQVQDTVDLAKRIHSTQNTFVQYIAGPMLLDGLEPQRFTHAYAKFEKISDYKRNDFFMNGYSLSAVPKKELNVIQSHFLWEAIFKKDYFENMDYYLFFKSIENFFHRLNTLKFPFAVKAVTEIARDFIRFFIEEHFYPDIHKLYKL